MYFLRLSHALALNSLVEREYECKKIKFLQEGRDRFHVNFEIELPLAIQSR